MYLTHGGDVYSARLAGKKAPLDFSANINPQGMPRAAVRAIRQNAARFSAYPDPLCRRLRAALAARYGVPPERIVCGAGAADLIYRLVRQKKPRRALVVQPTFSEYEKALAEEGAAGAVIERFYLKPPDFQLDSSIIEHIPDGTGMVFLCNPNNPTGTLIPPALVKNIIERCRETGALLVIDECFLGFVDGGQKHSAAHSAIPFLDGRPGLVVLNAFTKTYALAGLRLGFALFSDAAFASEVAALGQSWPCSLPAEAAALASLDATSGASSYLEKSRRLIRAERRHLYAGLTQLGFEVTEGTANFLFFRLPLPDNNGGDAAFNKKTFFDRLLERGILIRDCSNYPSLENGGYFRIAVKKPHENRVFLAALRSIGGLR